jgi:hypothetical protein
MEKVTQSLVVWVVFCKSPEGTDTFCHAFDTEASAQAWVQRTKLDRGVRALVGGIPQFRVDQIPVKTMKEA